MICKMAVVCFKWLNKTIISIEVEYIQSISDFKNLGSKAALIAQDCRKWRTIAFWARRLYMLRIPWRFIAVFLFLIVALIISLAYELLVWYFHCFIRLSCDIGFNVCLLEFITHLNFPVILGRIWTHGAFSVPICHKWLILVDLLGQLRIGAAKTVIGSVSYLVALRLCYHIVHTCTLSEVSESSSCCMLL